MAGYQLGRKQHPKPVKVSTDNLFRDGWWDIERVEDRFIFSFISGAQGGRIVSHAVAQEDFEQARKGQIGFEDLIRKYDQ